ncbi:MAG: endolytic transglycosylase MltG [candidate division WOR-3 bacterium]|nr:MAG: endolytic transglycosylase MltG [candidate division WOR-3 bacterium]
MKRLVPLLLLLALFCHTRTGKEVVVTIPKGSSTSQIADSLKARGVIDNPVKFRLLARLLGYDRKLRHGRYTLATSSEELNVLRALSEPGRTSIMVTIPEGYRLNQIAALLEENEVCPAADFIAACQDRVLLSSLAIPLNSAEGYLFPDTYDLELGAPASDVVRRLVARFLEVYEELRQEHAPVLDDDQTVILASILEREVALEDEVPVVAGIFLKRLKLGIPLQSCATVQYLLPVIRECLTIQDTKIESPYNTYLHPGLPPGPISNPGRRALRAAMQPAETEYLYFVARGDGSHIFSRTLREHEQAKHRVNSGA